MPTSVFIHELDRPTFTSFHTASRYQKYPLEADVGRIASVLSFRHLYHSEKLFGEDQLPQCGMSYGSLAGIQSCRAP